MPEETKQSELIGGPLDGTSVTVRDKELEVRKTYHNPNHIAVYSRPSIEGEKFYFKGYLKIPK